MKFVLFVTLIWSFLDSGWSITDEDLMRLEAGLAEIQTLSGEVQDLKNENQAGLKQIQVLTQEVKDLRNDNQDLRNENRAGLTQIQILMSEMVEVKSANTQLLLRVDHLDLELNERVSRLEETCSTDVDLDSAQNTTIEERVTFLELQMTEVQEEVVELEDQVAFLFDEQVIQDERIFILEQEITDLDSRVEVLEANGGGGGNVTALEVRVETLEGTAAEHDADIDDLESVTSNLDGRVETLEGETSDLETRLTAAETLIEDLQATDVELDSRISDLEEGEGGATNETIAFHAVMSDADNDNIPFDSTIIFSDAQVNEGNGYDPATGVFTVPSGGDGYYYFATHFTVDLYDYVYIDLRVNDDRVCSIYDNNFSIQTYPSSGGCNAVVSLVEGDEVQNVYWAGSSAASPVWEGSPGFYNGFTGFRI